MNSNIYTQITLEEQIAGVRERIREVEIEHFNATLNTVEIVGTDIYANGEEVASTLGQLATRTQHCVHRLENLKNAMVKLEELAEVTPKVQDPRDT